MPGTLKIWFHDGSTRDARYNPTPLINEPELGFETLAVSAIPATSGPAPADAHVAVIECDVDIRYRVTAPGGAEDATSPRAKPMAATGFRTATVGLYPGAVLSVVEAV